MQTNTSVSLGKHVTNFFETQAEQGRYGSASDIPRAWLRLLEEQKIKLTAPRAALIDGEQSGPAIPFDFEAFVYGNLKNSNPAASTNQCVG